MADFHDLVEEICESDNPDDEKHLILEQSVHLRTKLKQKNPGVTKSDLLTLMFMHSQGYPTDWAQMECILCLGSPSYTGKRLAYHAVSTLLQENSEILLLLTQSLMVDLGAGPKGALIKPEILDLALGTLGNIGDSALLQNARPLLDTLIYHKKQFVQRKAITCLCKLLTKNPDLAREYAPHLEKLLSGLKVNSREAKVISILELLERVLTLFPSAGPTLIKAVPVFLGLLEHRITVQPLEGLLICSILEILRHESFANQITPKLSKKMDSVLLKFLYIDGCPKNLFLELLKTILCHSVDAKARSIILEKLFRHTRTDPDKWIYFGVISLYLKPIDYAALEPFTDYFVKLLGSHDKYLQTQASNLLTKVIHKGNVNDILSILIGHLKSHRDDLQTTRVHLIPQIISVIQNFAPSPMQKALDLISLINLDPQGMPPEIDVTLLSIITSLDTSDQQEIVVAKLLKYNKKKPRCQIFAATAIWCLGEFVTLLPSVEAILHEIRGILISTEFSNFVVGYALNALIKLRYKSATQITQDQVEAINDIFREYKSNFNLEIATRAFEYLLLSEANLTPAKSSSLFPSTQELPSQQPLAPLFQLPEATPPPLASAVDLGLGALFVSPVLPLGNAPPTFINLL